MSIDNKKLKKLITITAAVTGTVFIGMRIVAKKKKISSVYEDDSAQKNPFEGKKVVLIEDENDKENADGVKGHLEAVGEVFYYPGFYERKVKRAVDVVLSFGGLVLLSPVFAAIALAIKIEDPGPVLFTQKRVGENKKYFKLHKFRSMKMSTPHDVPTHQLENPEQYITKVGKFLRAHSLDELPQIWDIFIGNMSVIGPRPGLWNQDLLTAERDKYGANNVKPGLTGWAQINGRDELEIPDKAKLDGEYVSKMGLAMDLKCFLGSVHVLGKDESVIEGGTGKMKKAADISEKSVMFNGTIPTRKKKVLVIGANSYIGSAVADYLSETPGYYEVQKMQARGLKPVSELFVGFDVVFDAAGIAHIKETDENRHLYYEVNRDLTIKIAEAAKAAGVKQFIILSSMSVYGLTTGHITKATVPNPINAYGESKLQADEALNKLSDENFTVAVLRPPMVYGKECKGNYQQLRGFALKSLVFPKYKNNRSMIYIGNLCEFVKRVIDNNASGLFFPQNKEYVCTSEMVRKIAATHNRKILMSITFNPIITIVPINLIKKVFGSLTYEKVDFVEKYNFYESIELTEMSIKGESDGK